MGKRTYCPYCENFQGFGFVTQGRVQVFNFCPICGRPYSKAKTESPPDRDSRKTETKDKNRRFSE